ncbi:MAG: hypothetical protein A3B13_02950 [Candidatus Liptonbacteria bacterium RIFCSPLOWO2_01_FULL_45_15]|uniref:Uncharacterized protein n=1 Tax=Candidatus Liptonbacteria bacterium RIFCSPLOWO2_01_FULL_45_15 TaxID=1798649 RepID=A0A1G2CF30_9BACT|nr:MAG: hypothetical protein A3B13_02950 [Candidatus Liptonbacteria bacterium RIFCSPLOWO2_01_FULL_45_15]
MIHGIQSGLPLCGFSHDVPKNWPNGHTFVLFYDVENMTCSSCRQEARRLQEAKEQIQGRPSRFEHDRAVMVEQGI